MVLGDQDALCSAPLEHLQMRMEGATRCPPSSTCLLMSVNTSKLEPRRPQRDDRYLDVRKKQRHGLTWFLQDG